MKKSPAFIPGARVYFMEDRDISIILEVENDKILIYRNKQLTHCKLQQLRPENEGPAPQPKNEAPHPKPKIVSPTPADDFDWTVKPKIPKVRNADDVIIKDHHGEKMQRYSVKKGRKTPDFMEIDLHLEQLVENPALYSPGEALQIQLKALADFMDEVQRRKITRAYIIHGIGKGTLKTAVQEYLERFAEAEVFDAPHSMYGQGATGIHMHYQGKNKTGGIWRFF